MSLADGTEEIDDPGGEFFGAGFEIQLLVGVEGREILEGYAVLSYRGLVVVDQLDAQHGEESLAFFGAPDLAVDSVAGLEVEKPYLGGGDIDIVGAREIGILGGSQKSVAIRQNFQRPIGVDDTALFGMGFQCIEDEFLLAQGYQLFVVDPVLFAQFPEFLDAHLGQVVDEEPGPGIARFLLDVLVVPLGTSLVVRLLAAH